MFAVSSDDGALDTTADDDVIAEAACDDVIVKAADNGVGSEHIVTADAAADDSITAAEDSVMAADVGVIAANDDVIAADDDITAEDDVIAEDDVTDGAISSSGVAWEGVPLDQLPRVGVSAPAQYLPLEPSR